MGKPARQHQYTVRGISVDVDRALRRKAKDQKLSLNQVIVDELSRAALGQVKRADFSDLVGKWTADAKFDEIVAGQRQIDKDLWD